MKQPSPTAKRKQETQDRKAHPNLGTCNVSYDLGISLNPNSRAPTPPHAESETANTAQNSGR
ncbi:hypothetical protein N7528_003725 [Penicillium herquei]|nr:hypothetical protein N7528_003725 [Penicillium herquei]